MKEFGHVDLPVPPNSDSPLHGAAAWTDAGVLIPPGTRYVRYHTASVPTLSYTNACPNDANQHARMPEGPLDLMGWEGNPPDPSSPDYGAVYQGFLFPTLPFTGGSRLSWKADPAGGFTALGAGAGGGWTPTFMRWELANPTCGVTDSVSQPGQIIVHRFPNYSLNGTQRIEFETIDISIQNTSPSNDIWVGDSVPFHLTLDPAIVVDSIRWVFLYWPKKPLPGIAAPQCNDQIQCKFAPTASGGRVIVDVFSFAGRLFAESVPINALNRCSTDPTLQQDTLLQSPTVRAALIALLDSSYADSAAGKRRERQVYFYRASSDTAAVPTIHVNWKGTDVVPPTPCQVDFQRQGAGSDFVLLGFGHSHPFTPGEIKPPECGANHQGSPYVRGPSSPDWKSQAALKVPGYIIDKQGVQKFRRKSWWSRETKVYPWNTAACHW